MCGSNIYVKLDPITNQRWRSVTKGYPRSAWRVYQQKPVLEHVLFVSRFILLRSKHSQRQLKAFATISFSLKSLCDIVVTLLTRPSIWWWNWRALESSWIPLGWRPNFFPFFTTLKLAKESSDIFGVVFQSRYLRICFKFLHCLSYRAGTGKKYFSTNVSKRITFHEILTH